MDGAREGGGVQITTKPVILCTHRLFLVFEHGLFGLQMLFAVAVDDVPSATRLQLERQEFLASKVVWSTW